MRLVSENEHEIFERVIVAFSDESIASSDAKVVVKMWLYPFLEKIKNVMLLSDKKLNANDIYQMIFIFEKLVCDEEEVSKI